MKRFTLYKRRADGTQIPGAELPANRERTWQFKFEFRGRKYSHSLETTDGKAAQSKANRIYQFSLEKIKAGESDRLDDVKLRHKVHATLGELFAAYRTSPVTASAKTREANIRATLNILRHLRPATCDLQPLEQLPFPQLLNGDTAEAWFKLTVTGVSPQSMNALWRFAASVCTTPGARYTYEKLKIWHPCLEAFAKTGLVCQQVVSKAPARPPSDEIIAATLKAWEDCEERNLFLAIGHELAFGLRAGEVAQARPSWWTVKYGSPMLCASGQFKHNHEGYFELPALDPFYTTMRTKALARGWLQPSTAEGYLITGSDSYRRDGIQREVSAFLRQLGWETNKTNHALRAYAGGLVCLKFGVYRAKEFLRHSSVKVTEQHYLYLMKHPLLDSIRDACPAKWATLTSESPPRIPPD